MTREYGEAWATVAGYIYENYWNAIIDDQEAKDKNMDLWNNAAGRDIGKGSESSDESAQKVFDAINNGGLIIDPDNDEREYSGFRDSINDWWNGFWDARTKDLLPFLLNLSGGLNDLFAAARDWIAPPPVDPLALDLDGDGIETVGLNGASSILFEHDGDGIRTATGWLKGDDAFLVLDRNGNGTIDNGSELFGADTVKSNGQKATSGLDALSDLDSNHDGVFDANDATFSQVSVWQDENQDGISQNGELKSFSELGIVSIDLSGTSQVKNLGNGNSQTATATFTRADGSQGNAGDLNLASNAFYRKFTDEIPLTDAIAALPGMRGAGAVRDLREAAQLSPELAAQLTALAEAGNIERAEYREKIIALVDAWASSADFPTSLDVALKVSADNDSAMHLHYLPAGVSASEASAAFWGASSSARSEQILAESARIEHMIEVLETFNGAWFVDFPHDGKPTVKTGAGTVVTATLIKNSLVPNLPPQAYVSLSTQQVSLIEQAYTALIDSVCDGLALQTRLESFMDGITLSIDENGLHFDTSGITEMLFQQWEENPRAALENYADLIRCGDKILSVTGWSGVSVLLAWTDAAQGNTELTALLKEFNIYSGAGTLNGTSGNDGLVGSGSNDKLNGNAGNDILIGGVGNDTLNGGTGSDTYRFARGDGQDTISDYDTTAGNRDVIELAEGIGPDDVQVLNNNGTLVLKIKGATDQITVSSHFGNPSYAIEEIHFADGTVWEKAQIDYQSTLGTDGNDTLCTIGDAHTLPGGAGNDKLCGRTGDDTLMGGTGNDLLYGRAGADILTGDDGDDKLYGEDGDDVLAGGAGADTLEAWAGNDTLDGGTGNDILSAGAGDDILTGGTGNDTLTGDTGNDTYRFARDDGQDTINNYDSTAGNLDVIKFAEGITPDDVQVLNSNGTLILKIKETTDQVTVANHFSTPSYAIEEIHFADGTVWEKAQIDHQSTLGTDGSDTLYTIGDAHTLTGGAGNDKLYGNTGNDTLIGGAGNDVLYGRAGADTLTGDEGDDKLYGEDGDDVLTGGAGADTLEAGAGNDTLNGGAGNDILTGGHGQRRSHWRRWRLHLPLHARRWTGHPDRQRRRRLPAIRGGHRLRSDLVQESRQPP